MSKPPTVVIIEDDELIGELIEYVVQREGYQSVWLKDGREAGAWLEATEAPSEAVIVDLVLPYASGWEILQWIRSNARWRSVPVLILTSSDDEKDVVRAFDMGASDFVSKPFRPVELVTRLKHQLARYKV